MVGTGATTDAFVSYAREDSSFVEDLLADLTKHGKTVWLDQRAIEVSEDWLAAISHGIEAAHTFVFVLSRHSAASSVCGMEVRHAVEHGKKILVLPLETLPAEKIPAAIARVQWLSGAREPTTIDELLSAMETDLAWKQLHTRLDVRSAEWQQNDGDRSRLLVGNALREVVRAVPLVPYAREPKLTALQLTYINASQAEVRARRRRTTLTAVSAVVVLAVLVVAVLRVSGQSNRNRRLADTQRQLATTQQQTALSRQLAASAQKASASQYDLALLLALEAVHTSPTVEAYGSLLSTLQESGPLTEFPTSRYLNVSDASLSADGRTVVSNGNEGVLVWDVGTGALRGGRALTSPSEPVLAVALADDGRTLVTASSTETVLRDARTGRPTAPPLDGLVGATSHDGFRPASAFFSTDQRALVVAGGQQVLVWQLRDGRPLDTRPAELSVDKAVRVAVSGDGRVIAVLDGSGSVSLWRPAEGSALQQLDVPGRAIDLAYDPQRREFLVAATQGSQGRLSAWPEQDAAAPRLSVALPGPPTAIAAAPTGRTAAVGLADSSVTLLDPGSGREQKRLPVPRPQDLAPERLSFSKDGRVLSVLGPLSSATVPNSDIAVWNVGDESRILRPLPLSPGTTGVRGLAFSPDGRTLAVSGRAADGDGTVSLWDPAQGTAAGPETRTTGGGQVVFRRPGSGIVALDADDRTVGASGVPAPDAGTPPAAGVHLALSPDGRHLASGYTDLHAPMDRAPTLMAVRDLSDGSVVELKDISDAESMAFSPDGAKLAVGNGIGEIGIWDTRTGTRLQNFEPRMSDGTLLASDATVRLAWSADGTHVAGLSAEKHTGILGHAAVWDLATGKSTVDNSAVFTEIALNADGSVLATGDGRGRVELFDVHNGRPLARLSGVRGAVTALAFDSTGSRLAASDGSHVAVWPARPRMWISAACAAANRNLTSREWSTHLGSAPYRRTCADRPAGTGAPADSPAESYPGP